MSDGLKLYVEYLCGLISLLLLMEFYINKLELNGKKIESNY